MASKGKSAHYHRDAPQPVDGDVARIQMDFMFVGAEGPFVDDPRAKATVLMVICKDDGNLSRATEVRTKTDEYGVEDGASTLEVRTKLLRSRRMGSPALSRSLREYKLDVTRQRLWHRRALEDIYEVEAVECASGTVQAQLRAYYLDVQERMKVRVVPDTQLFPWMLRHSVWTVVRHQSDMRTTQTLYERTGGCRYESALVRFGEVVMAKIADADKLRASKLDSAWVKAVWVGRVDKSNEHLLLTTNGCIKSRDVRRIPDGSLASYHAEVQGLPWDTLKGSAEMLRNNTVWPGEPPRPPRGRPRKDRSPAQARTTDDVKTRSNPR